MKKIICKTLIAFILIILLFEFAFSNTYISYAQDNEYHLYGLSDDMIKNAASLSTGIISVLLWIPKFIVTGTTWLVNQAMSSVAAVENTNDPGTITPYKVFFNEYDILDINIFKSAGGKLTAPLRESIATWYYIMRIIASAILLVILIYVGIRMALASIADDKAKYKKMLFDWVMGLALIFVMHYIAIFVIYCNEAIVNAIKAAYNSVNNNAEETINALCKKALIGGGLVADAAMIIYVGIVFQTIFYLIAYLNRMLKVGFLLVISPLITVTYSIDKMGDGKAQALDTWLKEYIYTILIQPFHCIIYFSFISVSFSLVSQGGFDFSYNQLSAGILAILCIKFINDGEKIVRKIFGFQDDNSKTSMIGGAMMAVAAVKATSNAIVKTKSGFTKGAAFANKFKKDAAKDLPVIKNMFNNTAVGRKVNQLGDKVKHSGAANFLGDMGDKAKELGNNVKDSGFGRAMGKFGNGIAGASRSAGKKITGFKNKANNFRRNTKYGRIADFAARKTLSTSAAIMAFAATYATGDTDMLSAIGYGSAAGKGLDKAFDSSSARNDADAGQCYAEADEARREELEQTASLLEDKIDKNEELLDKFDEVEEKVKELDDIKNGTSEYDKKAKQQDSIAEKAEQKAKQEEEAAKKALQKKAQPNMSKKDRTRLQKEADDHEKQAKNQRKLAEDSRKAAQKARDIKASKMQGLKDQISEMDSDGTIQKYLKSKETDKKGAFMADIFKDQKRLADINDEIKHYYDEERIKARLDTIENSVTDKQIKAKAGEIERLVQEIVAARHLLANSGGQDYENEIVSVDDMETGKMISDKLISSINNNFILHSKTSSMDLIRKAGLGGLDIDEGSGESEKESIAYIQGLMKELNLAVSQQKYNYAARGVGQAQQINASMGRSEDAFYSRSKSMAATQIESDGKKYIKGK